MVSTSDFESEGLGSIPSTPSKLENPTQCIVRLSTSYWQDNNSVHMKRTVRPLKRKSTGYYQFFMEDCSDNVEYAIQRIENLNSCEDGIYEIIVINEQWHWEYPGELLEYDYRLVPYEE